MGNYLQVGHYPKSRLDHVEDFWGRQLDARWLLSVGPGGVADQQDGGVYRFALTPAAQSTLNWNNIRSLLVSKDVKMEVRVLMTLTGEGYIEIALWYDSNNHIRFIYNPGGSGHTTWHIETKDGGVATDQDSGVTPDTSYHIFTIDCRSDGVHFYIDGVECNNSPITTTKPGEHLEPQVRGGAGATARNIDIDYIGWGQKR